MHKLRTKHSSAREEWKDGKERLGKHGELPHGDIALVKMEIVSKVSRAAVKMIG
jgi:hypothetical protein